MSDLTKANAVLRYCCEFMKQQLNYTCIQHGNKCPDIIIEISEAQFYKGGLSLIGRNAEYICNYCPSCGTEWVMD